MADDQARRPQEDAAAPRAKVEVEAASGDVRGAAPAADARTDAPDADVTGSPEGDASQAGTARRRPSVVSEWIRRTFPGHENAFMGGVAGLVVAIVIFCVGFWRTLLIVLLVVAGVAVGQALDGDPRIIRAVRGLFDNDDRRL